MNKKYKKVYNMENLTAKEKEMWIWFHENSYREDLKLAKDILLKYLRWSVIAAYYAMHDVSKLYLGKIHNIKIVGEKTHARTIELLKEYVKESKEKEKVIVLLGKAKDEFETLFRLNEKALPLLLRQGRQERTKAQYYSFEKETSIFDINFSKNATYFIDKIAEPFIKIMEKML